MASSRIRPAAPPTLREPVEAVALAVGMPLGYASSQHQRGERDNPRRGRQVNDHGSVSEYVLVCFCQAGMACPHREARPWIFWPLCTFGKSYGPMNRASGTRPRVVDGVSPKAVRYVPAKRPSCMKPK